MIQVSRDHNLKIPKKIEQFENTINNIEDKIEVKKSIAIANHKKINISKLKELAKEEDQELEIISKIPFNSSELIVITVVKKLGAYMITITEKSPKKFRGVFVNRMQNYCLEILEDLLQANFIRVDSIEHKQKREEYQKEAIIKLKLLGYISMVAESSGCILKKQYKQIAKQIAEAINLTTAWKKSDDERFKKRN